MLRTALVLAAATLLVACSPAASNAVLAANPAVQEAFFKGLKDTFVKNGASATAADCIVAAVKAKATPADFEGILKEDAAVIERLGKMAADAATTACL